MNVELMRSEISNVYTGKGWKNKVGKMSTVQVIAVYHSFVKNGRFRTQKKKQEGMVKYKQLSFDDLLIGYDEGFGKDHSALIVGKKDTTGRIATTIYYDEDVDLYFNREVVE